MEGIRKPFQGVLNIIRFNWHFYLLSIGLVLLIFISKNYLDTQYRLYLTIFCFVVIAGILISLIVSLYVYDLSNLYRFEWMNNLNINSNNKIINIHAGFDETSILLNSKYPDSELHVFDFYDPKKHTEVSIKRARKAYPPFKNVIEISTSILPLEDNYADNIFVIFSAHEIRNDYERVIFFKELNRVTRDSGKVIVTEHLRDLKNFLAYNIGFFHFLSKASWFKTFYNADFKVSKEIKITPFITTFILEKNGTTP